MRILRLLGAIGAAAPLLAAPGALGAKLKTVKETVTVGGLGGASAVPECKPKHKSISGGFAIAPAEADDVALVTESRKDGRRGWTAGSIGIGQEVTSYAYCAKPGKNPKTATQGTELQPDETGSLTAKCGPRGHAVSGGFFGERGSLFGPGVQVFESRMSGKSAWTVSARNGGGTEGLLLAYVHCRTGKALRAKSKTTSVPVSETGTVRAKCKPETRAVSGGFSVDFDFEASVALYVGASRRIGARKWEAAATNPEGVPGELTSYVYCEKKRK